MIVLFCALSLVGVLATLVALVTLHIVPTGLSPVRDAVSAYGVSRYHGWYRVQTLGTAVASVGLAVALPAAGLTVVAPAVIALVALAVFRSAISWFPMDQPGATRTAAGRVHDLLAFGAFAAASVGGFMVGIAFSADPGLEAVAGVPTALGWAMTIASALTLLAGALRVLQPIFGFTERLIYVGMLTWLACSAIALLGA